MVRDAMAVSLSSTSAALPESAAPRSSWPCSRYAAAMVRAVVVLPAPGAADDLGKIGLTGGVEDRSALLGGERRRRSANGLDDGLGLKAQPVPGRELRRGHEEPDLGLQVLARRVAVGAAGVASELEDVVRLQGFTDERHALGVMKGGAAQVGLGEGGPGLGEPADERRRASFQGLAEKRDDGPVHRGRSGRLGLLQPVVAEGRAEALRELGTAQRAVHVGEGDGAGAVGHHEPRAGRG